MLRKIQTQHVRPCVQAAFAESNDSQLELRVEQAMQFMRSALSRFFRIENEAGAFVGYFIMAAGELLSYKLRPHFSYTNDELNALFAEAQDARFFGSLGPNNFITLNIL